MSKLRKIFKIYRISNYAVIGDGDRGVKRILPAKYIQILNTVKIRNKAPADINSLFFKFIQNKR